MIALSQVRGKGQELRTNAAGEKIIVYADGSARYFNDLTPVGNRAGGREGEEPAYPVLAVDIAPPAEPLTPTEADLRRITERRLTLAREALTLAGTRASAATTNREHLERQLREARENGTPTIVEPIMKRYNLAKSLEDQTHAGYRAAETNVADLETTLSTGRYVATYNAEQRRRQTGLSKVDLPTGTDRKLSLLLPKEPAFTGYGAATTRAGLREPLPCAGGLSPDVPSNGATPVTPLLPFFTFTEPTLRPFLEGKEYLTTTAYTARSPEGTDHLHVRLSFSQPTARNAYGNLPAGASLSVHFLNGRSITLEGERQSVGIVDHQRQVLNYDVDYLLPRAAVQALQRQVVDFVRVYWSNGYEEYPVLRVEALQRLVRCLVAVAFTNGTPPRGPRLLILLRSFFLERFGR